MKTTTITIGLCALLAAACLLAAPADAARFRQGGGTGINAGSNFVDANGDGVCDWYQSEQAWNGTTGGRYGDWVDANGDGICDHAQDPNFVGPQDGTGNGFGGGR